MSVLSRVVLCDWPCTKVYILGSCLAYRVSNSLSSSSSGTGLESPAFYCAVDYVFCKLSRKTWVFFAFAMCSNAKAMFSYCFPWVPKQCIRFGLQTFGFQMFSIGSHATPVLSLRYRLVLTQNISVRYFCYRFQRKTLVLHLFSIVPTQNLCFSYVSHRFPRKT